MNTDLLSYLSSKRPLIEEKLKEQLSPLKSKTHPLLFKAAEHSLLNPGKRLRPLLVLATVKSLGECEEIALGAACAIEILHTYSLIHDDLPCMDDDDFRRGRPTSHKVFGEGMAVLAGDALLTAGFELMARNARVRGVTADAVARVIETVGEAAGSRGMVGGQAVDLQMAARTKGLPKSARARRLDYIHRHKTGALIRASLRAGALLAGAGRAQLSALDRYGESIGLAFQIADDVLDIVGNKKILGKKGSDRDNDKLTYPAVYGLEASQRKAREEIARAKGALKPFGPRARVFMDLADFIVQREN